VYILPSIWPSANNFHFSYFTTVAIQQAVFDLRHKYGNP